MVPRVLVRPEVLEPPLSPAAAVVLPATAALAAGATAFEVTDAVAGDNVAPMCAASEPPPSVQPVSTTFFFAFRSAVLWAAAAF
jgi:hypothetical protein